MSSTTPGPTADDENPCASVRDLFPVVSVRRGGEISYSDLHPGLPGLPPRFICPQCQAISYRQEDVAEGYCGQCHDWTGPHGEPENVAVFRSTILMGLGEDHISNDWCEEPCDGHYHLCRHCRDIVVQGEDSSVKTTIRMNHEPVIERSTWYHYDCWVERQNNYRTTPAEPIEEDLPTE